MPEGSLPPAHWAGMPGRQGVEKIHPAINFTMHSKVRGAGHGVAASFLPAGLTGKSGFSVRRVAFGCLPNPRRRRLLPLRLLLTHLHLPPRWWFPRRSETEPFIIIYYCAGFVSSTRARAAGSALKEKGRQRKKKKRRLPLLVLLGR